MPMKPGERAAEIDELLEQLLKILGERWVEDHLFYPDDSSFQSITATAWLELERQLLINRKAPEGKDGFYLTPRGWLVGIMGGEWIFAPEWANKRVYTLLPILKGYVNREDIAPTRVPLSEIAQASGISEGWIRNLVVSRMIGHIVKDKHMDVTFADGCLVIKGTFGQPRLAK